MVALVSELSPVERTVVSPTPDKVHLPIFVIVYGPITTGGGGAGNTVAKACCDMIASLTQNCTQACSTCELVGTKLGLPLGLNIWLMSPNRCTLAQAMIFCRSGSLNVE